jgi:hypothetical protein
VKEEITIHREPVSIKATESHRACNTIRKKLRKSTFCAFIDFKKAYDAIDRNLLWGKLTSLGDILLLGIGLIIILFHTSGTNPVLKQRLNN